MDTSVKEVNRVQIRIQESTSSQQFSKEAIQSIECINQLRIQNGKNSINHDSLLFSSSKCKGYLIMINHTNPQRGMCLHNMKFDFGLNSNENVTENKYLTTINNKPTIYNISLNKVMDG